MSCRQLGLSQNNAAQKSILRGVQKLVSSFNSSYCSSSLCFFSFNVAYIQITQKQIMKRQNIASFLKVILLCSSHSSPSESSKLHVTNTHSQHAVLSHGQCSGRFLSGAAAEIAGCRFTFMPYTSVAMTHSFFVSVITKTDWYIESLGEHIVDILH